MILKDHASGLRFLDTSGVVESAIGCRYKLIAWRKDSVWYQAWIPDRGTHRVAVPVIIRNRHIAEVIEFFSRVVLMNIGFHTINGAVEVVGTILDTPEPVEIVNSDVLELRVWKLTCYCRRKQEQLHFEAHNP